MTFTEEMLDDAASYSLVDPDEMLRHVATAGAQVRAALARHQGAFDALSTEGGVRSLVICGMGGSGVSGDALAAVLGISCSIPVQTVRGYALPGWIGALDLVVGVSCSGNTEETLACMDEAVRRGALVVLVGTRGSKLNELANQSGSLFLPVESDGRPPRANFWELLTPLVLLAERLDLIERAGDVLGETAAVLDDWALRCAVGIGLDGNPGKMLATSLAGCLPMAWGTGEIGAIAATRLATQLAENAKLPAIAGTVPEAQHNQVVMFDGPLAGGDDTDFFRDRVDDVDASLRLSLVLVRDHEEPPAIARRADVSAELAEERGIAVTQLRAQPGPSLVRLASLFALIDFASVYLAIGSGIDPTPIAPIDALKAAVGG